MMHKHVGEWPVWGTGFRIFFLLGALWAVVMVAVWTAVYALGWSVPTVFPSPAWHGREMLFGFAGAIISAFLLTAPANWTGHRMLHGKTLAALASLWLAGRLLPFLGERVPQWLVFVVDVSFYPVLGVYLFIYLFRAGQTRNLFFAGWLMLFGLFNAATYAGWRTASGALLGTEGMLYSVLVIIAIMAGRVIPSFTRGRFPQARIGSSPRLDRAAMILLIVAMITDLSASNGWWNGLLFGVAAALHGSRCWRWYSREIFRDPLTWVLHAAYAWLVIGLVLKALWGFEIGHALLPRHTLSVGAVGTITLGMMCRVTIGHTGHSFVLPRGTSSIFLLITLSAMFRVLLPLCAPHLYLLGVQLSALTWVLAFGTYLVQYGPMLWRPRPDGLPG